MKEKTDKQEEKSRIQQTIECIGYVVDVGFVVLTIVLVCLIFGGGSLDAIAWCVVFWLIGFSLSAYTPDE